MKSLLLLTSALKKSHSQSHSLLQFSTLVPIVQFISCWRQRRNVLISSLRSCHYSLVAKCLLVLDSINDKILHWTARLLFFGFCVTSDHSLAILPQDQRKFPVILSCLKKWVVTGSPVSVCRTETVVCVQMKELTSDLLFDARGATVLFVHECSRQTNCPTRIPTNGWHLGVKQPLGQMAKHANFETVAVNLKYLLLHSEMAKKPTNRKIEDALSQIQIQKRHISSCLYSNKTRLDLIGFEGSFDNRHHLSKAYRHINRRAKTNNSNAEHPQKIYSTVVQDDFCTLHVKWWKKWAEEDVQWWPHNEIKTLWGRSRSCPVQRYTQKIHNNNDSPCGEKWSHTPNQLLCGEYSRQQQTSRNQSPWQQLQYFTTKQILDPWLCFWPSGTRT